MIVLTKKEYDIEEPIQVKNENGDLIVDYMMKITPDEKLKIRDLIFDENDVKVGRKMSKLQREGNIDELEKLEAKSLENAKARQEEFEKIIFKDEREKIKKTAGESAYLDLVSMLLDFFVRTFAEKQASQMNTLATHLRKISNS